MQLTQSSHSLYAHLRTKPLKLATLILIFLAPGIAAAERSNYQYAGISADTRIADIKARYPRSSFHDGYIRVSETDSHNYVFSISVSSQRVRVGFQKTDFESGHQYPTCESVSRLLIETNGQPSDTQEFYEEIFLSQRLIWKSQNESMVLQCFKRDNVFLAEAVSFYTG